MWLTSLIFPPELSQNSQNEQIELTHSENSDSEYDD